MDWNEIRSLFGFEEPVNRVPCNKGCEESNTNERFDDGSGRHIFVNTMFPFGEMMRDMFQMISTMERDFGLGGNFNVPSLEVPPESEEYQSGSIRDQLLKDPRNSNRRDVNQSEDQIDTFSESQSPLSPTVKIIAPQLPQFTSSCSKSYIYKTVRGVDGRVEEHKVYRDSQGNEETTITQRLGDKTFTTTTKKDQKGIIEENKQLINMDENELQDFRNKWGYGSSQPETTKLITPRIEQTEDRVRSLFRRWFGDF